MRIQTIDKMDEVHQAPHKNNTGECRCIQCGKNAACRFRALEVRTLHVRDMDREKRVQALGDYRDFAVCTECAEQKLREIVSYRGNILRKCLPFGLIFAIGCVLTAVFISKDRVMMTLGIAAIICGILGIWSFVTKGTEKAREYKVKSKEKALHDASWELITECAPAKEGDNDLTYIPIDPETLSRKNGDLMVLYDLLPDIAVQAHKKLHEI